MLPGCIFAAVVAVAPPAPEGCRYVSPRFLECARAFAALEGAEERWSVHLPEGFAPSSAQAWPVILLLHGAGRDHRTLWDHSATRAALERSRSVIVMPNGRGSWWLGRYAAYPLELLDWLSPRLGLSGDARRRAVAGWSMGGYGSVRLIQRHPDRFAAWGGMLALLDFPNPAYPPEHNHAVPAVFGPPEQWQGHNPLAAAETLRGQALFFVTGSEAFDRRMNRAFHRRLTRLGIPHEYSEVPGGHTFEVVAAALPQMLEFLDRQIAKDLPESP